MLHRLLLFIPVIISAASALHAQSKWVWAKNDGAVTYNINPTYPRQVVAAHNSHTLWGVIQNKKMTYGQVMLGDYKLADYDAAGAAMVSTTITGKVSLTAARADASGNWYVLGYFYDTVRVSNGMSITRSVTDGEYFLLRLHAGTLAPDWLQPVGSNYFCGTDCFTLRGGDIYLPVDSSYGTAICKYNTVTGARTTLWSQTGRTNTSYIDADDAGNIYLMGNCALNGGISFNGTPSSPPASAQYPWYIARYHNNGQHHWHYWLTDITCIARSFVMGGNNAVYLSGALADSTSLGAHSFIKPVGIFNTDFLMARLDSSGALVWAQQRPVTRTPQGNIFFGSQFHMAVADTMLYMFCETQGQSIWSGTVITQTTTNRHNGTLVAYSASGIPKWAKTIEAGYTIAQHIITDGPALLITGVGSDSAAIQFDSVGIATTQGNYIPYLAKMDLAQGIVPTGIQSLVTPSVTAWPNPAKTMLYLHADEGLNLTIRDITGRMVWHKTVQKAVEPVETAAWPRGLYVLEAASSKGRSVMKVLLD
jgi:hypothetical protein